MKRVAIIAPLDSDKANKELNRLNSMILENEKNHSVDIDLYISSDRVSAEYKNTNIIDIKSDILVEAFKNRRSSLSEDYYSVWVKNDVESVLELVSFRSSKYDFPIYYYLDEERISLNVKSDSLKKIAKSGVQFIVENEKGMNNIKSVDSKAAVKILSPDQYSLEGYLEIINIDAPSPLISVIVPVYNVQDYLKRCVDTLINQTYKNLEIILVDDGSKDNGGVICDELAELDSRIIVIHKQNAGLSAARNSGLDICKGEYIFFVDSDDAVDVNTIEKMYYQANRYNADVVACGYGFVDDEYFEGKTEQEPISKNVYGCWNGYEAVLELIKGKTIGPVAWNKLYKAELWKELRYPEGKIHEDEATTYKALYNSSIVVFVPDTFYKYYRRAGSIMSTALGKRKNDYLDAIKGRMEYFHELGENYLTAVSEVKYLDYLRYLYRNIEDKAEKKNFAKEFDNIIDKYSVPSIYGIKKSFGLILWKYWRY